MQFNPDNFITISKGWGYSAALPAKSFRINSSTVTLSQDLTTQFSKDKSDDEGRVTVAFDYSEADKALRLRSAQPTEDGFTFKVNPEKSPCAMGPTPKGFKHMQVPRGLYKEHPEHPGIFVLDDNDIEPILDRKARYLSEALAGEGDIVSWVYRPDRTGRGASIATGEIKSLWEKGLPDKTTETWALIDPISSNYLEDYPTRNSTNVKLNNLIVREKA